jgi:GNAT superfamily N-acetyltransferase
MPLVAPFRPLLARSAEVAERDAWADQLHAGAALAATQARIQLASLGAEGLAFSVASVPMTLFNRVVGLGLTRTPNAAELDAVPNVFSGAPAGRWAVQPAPGLHEPAFERLLDERGYQPLPQRIAKMARDLTVDPQATPPLPLDCTLVRAGRAEAQAFAGPIVEGMGLPPWFRDWLAALPGGPGWHAYALLHLGTPVAAAAMFRRDDVAWLGMATTLPAFRGRGAQRFLMLQRLADATHAGCRVACTETGEPQAAEPHPSYSNMLACGLQRVATRISWALPS